MRVLNWFHTLPMKLRSLFRRSQLEQELDEELRYRIERKTEHNVANGISEAEARRAALNRHEWNRAHKGRMPRSSRRRCYPNPPP